ncbi:MAG: YgiQ family radical SAM protein, partial [Clostridia bacterium]|nr:YgiQ family radical SAM protein [Clostridia bacterium]
MDRNAFLPVSRADMTARGIEQLDFVYITGDAYVDHPSFGTAIISRILESHGFSVGIIAQPDWKAPESVTVLGEPKLGFLVSSGNMDSMVNHYSVTKKRRRQDAYSPGGEMGRRPDYAAVVYSNLIRRTYKKTPIILGGIEASLRRLGHYDYWSDKMKRSILMDSGADIISYGMGERSIVEIAEALQQGIPVRDISFVRGTVYKASEMPLDPDCIHLPAFDKIATSKELYAKS